MDYKNEWWYIQFVEKYGDVIIKSQTASTYIGYTDDMTEVQIFMESSYRGEPQKVDDLPKELKVSEIPCAFSYIVDREDGLLLEEGGACYAEMFDDNDED